MSGQQENRPIDRQSDRSASESQHDSKDGQPYVYRHAGIKERDGHIPFWLILVVAGLIAWSVYYAIRYWSAS